MKNRGFTIFVAVIIVGTITFVAAGIISLAVRHLQIANSGESSQHAFYAADSGIECALYWDVRNPSGQSAFSTTTGTMINCNRDANNLGNQWVVGGNAAGLSTINRINFLPDPYCAIVTVNKAYVSGVLTTTIESKGYNTCDLTNPRRVERAVRATY